MFQLGLGVGLWEGILGALRIPYMKVAPATWKTKMGVIKHPDASRITALELFPQVEDELARKKDNGRADSLLLAEYGRRQKGS